MTKVARLFEEEKIEAVNEAVNEAIKNEKLSMAQKMLWDGEDVLKVMRYTGFTKAEIDKIHIELKASVVN